LLNQSGAGPSPFFRRHSEAIPFVLLPASAREVTASVVFLWQQVQLFEKAEPDVADLAERAREDLVQALFSPHDFVTIR
jgi:hypothetical protein